MKGTGWIFLAVGIVLVIIVLYLIFANRGQVEGQINISDTNSNTTGSYGYTGPSGMDTLAQTDPTAYAFLGTIQALTSPMNSLHQNAGGILTGITGFF